MPHAASFAPSATHSTARQMPLDYTVSLRSMRFHTHVGVLAHEAEIPQTIEVDVAVEVSRSPTAHGAEGIVDYRDIYDSVARVAESGHVPYLEDMADSMADEIFRSAPLVLAVSIAVRKPHVSLGGPLSHAEVTIKRRRE